MKIFRQIAKSILDWMITLKIEDTYIQKEHARQQRANDAHRAEVERLRNKRISKEKREYERATRIGKLICKSAELCIAAYGRHNNSRGHQTYRICHGDSARSHNGGFKSVCTQCGMLFDHNRIDNAAPLHHIGSYCDCGNCRDFVGSKSPFVKADPPEEWVIRAKWSGDKIRVPKDERKPVYATTDN